MKFCGDYGKTIITGNFYPVFTPYIPRTYGRRKPLVCGVFFVYPEIRRTLGKF
jgi:hypothetical protein